MAKCENCGTEKITQKVVDYSMKNFDGKILCFECQKKAKGITGNSKPDYKKQGSYSIIPRLLAEGKIAATLLTTEKYKDQDFAVILADIHKAIGVLAE